MLHGDICVNGIVVGDWEARRMASERDPETRGTKAEAYLYQCKVSRWITAGERINDDFEVFHWYADGAMELASKVLRQAAMRGVP